MGAMRNLDVTLSEELIFDIDRAVQGGEYSGRDDVIAEAIRLWRRHRTAELDRIRRLVQEALDSGEPIEGNFDPDDIHRRGMERLKRERAA